MSIEVKWLLYHNRKILPYEVGVSLRTWEETFPSSRAQDGDCIRKGITEKLGVAYSENI
jgi:hypothetical protein